LEDDAIIKLGTRGAVAAGVLCCGALLVWVGVAAADTPPHESHGASDQGAMTHSGHGASPAVGVDHAGETEEELAYSLFMHHSSGVVLILLGALVLADRVTGRRHGAFQISVGLVWLLFGLHLFIRSDPEGWPVGPAGFLESFLMPTASEWIQHKVLSLIPLALGVWTFVSRRVPMSVPASYAMGAVLALGGAALMIHQHADHPGMDIVNLQHRFMALTALFIAGSSVADGLARLTWKAKPFLLPCGLMVLGLQLALYVE
jgi:putative copper resistance protein D